ncbi:nucleotidyltransferase family protein [Fervidibacter sacchari]
MLRKKSVGEKGKLAKELAEKCLQILREKYGVKSAFIFGSLRGDSPFDERSDIDIAVEGLPPERFFEALTELHSFLPEGIEVDLVPLERARPSLVALAKGEVEMPKEPVEALKVEVGYELKELERIVGKVKKAVSRLRKPPKEERLIALGKYVHDFYECVERIFERIEKRLEVSIPTGSSWHTHLLRQMEQEIEGKRPAVIDHDLALRLHRYLRFRHLFRHTYGYELVWEELRPLVEGLPEVFNALRTQLESFLAKLKSQGAGSFS